MPKYRFTYEVEADDLETAYAIAADNLGCFDVEEIEPADPPKCGNHKHVPFGFVRMGCEYDENAVCIHCGAGIPF